MMKKIGITFGGYCPLHQGHLDLIMKAKKENDICYVVVCGYNNEPRAEEIHLNLTERESLIYHMFEHDEQVVVISVNDTELEIDESMSESNWDIWLKYVQEEIEYHMSRNFDSFDAEFTFYVSEEHYKTAIDARSEKFKICQHCDYTDRSENPISGTEIRNNPIKFWNKIAKPFRSTFCHNILVLGTASEGKSTLVRDIATYFGIPYTTEFGRDYMEEHELTDEDLTIYEFMQFLQGQTKYCKDAIEQSSGVMISDTDNLVTLMYAKAYTEDSNIDVCEHDYKLLLNYAKQIKNEVRWSKIFFLTPNNTFVDDGVRYMKQASMEERTKNADILKELLKEFNLEDKVTYLNGGEYLNNFNTIKNYINSLYA